MKAYSSLELLNTLVRLLRVATAFVIQTPLQPQIILTEARNSIAVNGCALRATLIRFLYSHFAAAPGVQGAGGHRRA